MFSVAWRDLCVPAGNIGSDSGTGILNCVWKSSRSTFASSRSSCEPARCGCVAYFLDAARASFAFGIDLGSS